LDIRYAILPFFSWFVAGTLKAIISRWKTKQWQKSQIGYGGMPSNHSSIVCSMSVFIGLTEGIYNPSFGVSLTLAFIVMLDANALRKHIEQQAKYINLLMPTAKLRERIGHSKTEILGGIITGSLCGWLFYFIE
jgi:hypothetical protein